MLGGFLAVTLVPEWLQGHFHKLQLGTGGATHLGAAFAAEAALGLALNVVVLWAGETQRKALGTAAATAATVALVVGGSYLGTGPSLNPAVTFSW